MLALYMVWQFPLSVYLDVPREQRVKLSFVNLQMIGCFQAFSALLAVGSVTRYTQFTLSRGEGNATEDLWSLENFTFLTGLGR